MCAVKFILTKTLFCYSNPVSTDYMISCNLTLQGFLFGWCLSHEGRLTLSSVQLTSKALLSAVRTAYLSRRFAVEWHPALIIETSFEFKLSPYLLLLAFCGLCMFHLFGTVGTSGTTITLKMTIFRTPVFSIAETSVNFYHVTLRNSP
jgi:hypothetical protein